ncbi:MAG: hypothetical protein RR619_02925, partial [Raoultibacter sp.]
MTGTALKGDIANGDTFKRRTYMIRCFLSLSCVFLGGWLLNTYMFPLFDETLTWTREISTLANAGVLIVVALVATWRPQAVAGRPYGIATLICLLVGLVLLGVGIPSQSTAVVICGAVLASIGRGSTSVIAGLACVEMKLRDLSICVAGASLLCYALQNVFITLPSVVGIVVFALCPFASLALSFNYAWPLFEKARKADPPAQLAITQPSSFLPFQHQLFMCILLFRVAYGYALTLGEIDGVPLATTFALIPIIAVFCFAVASKKQLDPDRLFQAAFLLIVTGLLLLTVSSALGGSMVNTFVSAGVGCFEILSWYILAALGTRNKSGAITVFSWGFALNSLGVVVGANLGRLTNINYGIASELTPFMVALAILLFVAYVVVIMHGFSFAKTIEGVQPDQPPVAHTDVEALENRCVEIGARYGLTA